MATSLEAGRKLGCLTLTHSNVSTLLPTSLLLTQILCPIYSSFSPDASSSMNERLNEWTSFHLNINTPKELIHVQEALSEHSKIFERHNTLLWLVIHVTKTLSLPLRSFSSSLRKTLHLYLKYQQEGLQVKELQVKFYREFKGLDDHFQVEKSQKMSYLNRVRLE